MKIIYLFFILCCFCKVYSQNSTASIAYDNLSRITTLNQNGSVTIYTYDELGNRIGKTVSQPKSLSMHVLLEGLYNPVSNQLNKAQNQTGDAFAGNVADSITVELHQGTAPYARTGSSYRAALLTSGLASLQIPAVSGQYYLVVKHRNSVETWSASPVNLVPGTNVYDFTLNESAAFGANLKSINGRYCIFAGDADQDGAVDGLDMILIDNQAAGFGTGYLAEDLNGDGAIDAIDMILLDNNAAAFVAKIVP